MALGTITKVLKGGQKPSAPQYADLITVVGDSAYAAGGTAGFLAAFQKAMSGQARTILGVIGCSQPNTVSELEYDFTNDKLFARVRATQAESAVTDQSAVTYRLLVLSE